MAVDAGLREFVLLLAEIAVRDDAHRVCSQLREGGLHVGVEAALGEVVVEEVRREAVGGVVGERRVKDFAEALAALLEDGQLTGEVAGVVALERDAPPSKERARSWVGAVLSQRAVTAISSAES